MAYRPDVDGLRAVAVILVLVHHAFPRALPGGFVGVDVFFVISGYLITGILLREAAEGRFSLLGFYGRRVRRIFPALLAVMACTLGYGFVALLPSELAALGRDVAAGAGFVANIALWGETGYFDRGAALKPLLHLWSLGVEEQFYLAWPLVLVLALRWGRVAAVVAGMGLASLALNLAMAGPLPSAAFYLPVTRFWELLVGAGLAWWHRRGEAPGGGRGAAAASFGGITLIGAAGIVEGAVAPVLLALPACLGAALLIGAGRAAPVNRWVLSNPVAVWVGLISYPLYLWHWPLLSTASILRLGRAPTPLMAGVLLAAAVVLAWVTWRVLERPLRHGPQGGRKAAWLAAAMAVLGVLGGVTWLSGGFPGRHPDAAQGGATQGGVARVNFAAGDGVFRPTADMRVRREGAFLVAEIGPPAATGRDAVLLTGDSVVFQYGPRAQALLERGELGRRVIFVSGGSCAPVPGLTRAGPFARCDAMPGRTAAIVREEDVRTIVVGGFWGVFVAPGAEVVRDGARLPVETAAGREAVYANLEDAVTGWVREGRAVHLILPPPTHPRFDPRRMVTRSVTGVRVAPDMAEGVPVAEMRAATAEAASRLRGIADRTGARLLDPFPDVCGEGPACPPLMADGSPKYADDIHLRPVFVREGVRMLDGVLGRRPGGGG